MPTFGEWLRQERQARGLYIVDLEQKSGVSRSMISRIERDDARAAAKDAATVRDLAHALGVSKVQAFAAAGLWPEGLTTEDAERELRIKALPPNLQAVVNALIEALENAKG